MIFYRRWHPVKALTFDLDDTLYDNHPHMRRAEAALLRFIHDHHAQTQHTDLMFWRSQRAKLLDHRPELQNDMAELRRLGLQSGFSACGLGGSELDMAVSNSYHHFYQARSDFDVDKRICDILAALAAKVPLVAITNGNVNLEAIGIAQYFSHSFHASLDSPMKPDPHMFEQAQAVLDLSPECILHVGDNLEKDVWGAINAGFRACWYAHGRHMNIEREAVWQLPDVQIGQLQDLVTLIAD